MVSKSIGYVIGVSMESQVCPANRKKRGADERTRTAYPCSLRVRNRGLPDISAACYGLQKPLIYSGLR